MTSSILPIASITFKEGLRHKLLYSILVVAFLVILFSVFFSTLFMRDIMKVLLDLCLCCVSLAGLLVPFFLMINLLSGDIETRTIYTILAKPVSRSSYIIGKYLGFALLTAVITVILTAATFIAVYWASHTNPARFYANFRVTPIILSVFTAYLGTLVLNSVVMLWCSITTSSFLATLLTLFTYFIGHSAEDVVRFLNMQIKGVDFSPIVTYTNKIVLFIFPNLSAFNFKQLAVYGLPILPNEVAFLFAYALVYISIMLLLAILVFRNRDIV